MAGDTHPVSILWEEAPASDCLFRFRNVEAALSYIYCEMRAPRASKHERRRTRASVWEGGRLAATYDTSRPGGLEPIQRYVVRKEVMDGRRESKEARRS